MKKKNEVFSQYIDQYLPTIHNTLRALRSCNLNPQIPYAQFLFSVTEYFGLLYLTSKGIYEKKSPNNFIDFFGSQHFPVEERCKSRLLWLIRNGLMHQIFPKGCGIGVCLEDQLFFSSKNNNNMIILNLRYFDAIIILAVESLIKNFEENEKLIENLHKKLIIEHYGFDDHKELDKEILSSFGGDYSKIFSNC